MILAADWSNSCSLRELALFESLLAFYGVRAFQSGMYSTLVPAHVAYIVNVCSELR